MSLFGHPPRTGDLHVPAGRVADRCRTDAQPARAALGVASGAGGRRAAGAARCHRRAGRTPRGVRRLPGRLRHRCGPGQRAVRHPGHRPRLPRRGGRPRSEADRGDRPPGRCGRRHRVRRTAVGDARGAASRASRRRRRAARGPGDAQALRPLRQPCTHPHRPHADQDRRRGGGPHRRRPGDRRPHRRAERARHRRGDRTGPGVRRRGRRRAVRRGSPHRRRAGTGRARALPTSLPWSSTWWREARRPSSS